MTPSIALTRERRRALPVYTFEPLNAFGADIFVTSRHGGVSHGPYDSLNLGSHVLDEPANVAVNRELVARAAGVAPSNLLIVHQVHGTDVVDAASAETPATGDIVRLGDTKRAAAILVADCVPVVILSPSQRLLVLAHAGWRGLADDVLVRSVALMTQAGDLVAGIGPCISSASYQVGPEVAQHFAHIDGAVLPDVADRHRLDLRAVAQHQLVSAGLAPSNVWVATESTDGGTTFFSDRAQRPCGRFALVATWPS